jgi:hypothetical protein
MLLALSKLKKIRPGGLIPGGYSRIGGYRVFLVAIEYPISQLVDRLFGVFK